MKRNLFLFTFLVLVLSAVSAQEPAPRLKSNNIKEVIAAMTLEEKASLVVGTGMRFQGAAAVGTTRNRVPGAAGTTFAIPRLGIPSMVLADGPAGLRISPVRRGDSTRTYYCTAFPVASLLASTWDVELVKEVGQSIGKELLEYGVDVLLAPALNIHRNPLCGRNFEYYSEDPLVSGKMAAAMVQGVQSHGVGTSLKHFSANNTETNRTSLNTIVTERALREIYLRGFEIAVKEARPWTVMSAYNLINGTYASQSHDLLTDILRSDWGFEGFVMTDWFGGTDPVAQMDAGNDLLMPGRPEQTDTIIKAVRNGSLDESVLDMNVERILNIVVKSPAYKGYMYSSNPDLEDHAQIARRAGSEGMVLLRNQDGALPVSPGSGPLAVFGNTSYEIITGGTGSGDVNEAYSISLLQGLKAAGFKVDDSLAARYIRHITGEKARRPERRRFMPAEPVPEMELDKDSISGIAGRTGMALITIGRNSGEFRDRTVEDFYLGETEKELIEMVSSVYHAAGKKVIVILNTGGVVETVSWRDHPDAILLAWQAGQETGNAIADVLAGSVNPSGKLATTFPVTYEDVPSSATFPGQEIAGGETGEGEGRSFMSSRPSRIVYEDGIYVGYRYYEAFNVETAYEFGYGLSYTTFGYGEVTLSSGQFTDPLHVELDITNTGNVAGKEVVQLYISAPGAGKDRPVRELKAFTKTRLLDPGESQRVTFTIDLMSLCSFDEGTSSWIAPAGTYEVQVGASSGDIRQKAGFTLDHERRAATVSRSLVPREEIHVLTPE
jgi:beta-glucosidase